MIMLVLFFIVKKAALFVNLIYIEVMGVLGIAILNFGSKGELQPYCEYSSTRYGLKLES